MSRYVLAHKSSQTGDTLHVAGALAFEPTLHVIVVHAGAYGSAEGLLNFYRQVTDPGYLGEAVRADADYENPRVRAVYASTESAAQMLYDVLGATNSSEAQIEDEFPKILAKGDLSERTPKIGEAPPLPTAELIKSWVDFKKDFLTFDNDGYKFLGPLGQTTSIIAERFAKAKLASDAAAAIKACYSTLAQKLTARTLKTADILEGTIESPKFGPHTLPDANPSKTAVFLLWARYTGTNTAIAHNARGDSCVQGQAQLHKLLTDLGHKVITIGHGPRGAKPFKGDFDVGEFYKQAPIGGDRATQQSFFLALMEKYPGRLYQIGQKTGGMDGAALLGVPTIYLEAIDSAAITRMKKWSESEGKSDVPTVPYYRAFVTKVPAPAIVRAIEAYIPDKEGIYTKQTTGWKNNKDPVLRTCGRLAAMLYAYPELMGKEEFSLSAKEEWKFLAMPLKYPFGERKWKEKEEANRIGPARFKDIADFFKGVKDEHPADLAENSDPANDGSWVKKIQSVNSSMQIHVGKNGTAGYLDNPNKQPDEEEGDIEKIAALVKAVVNGYSTEPTAILRTSTGYQTRAEANLL